MSAKNDSAAVIEGEPKDIDVLHNDKLNTGAKAFTVAGPSTAGSQPAAGDEFLVYGDTGQGGGSGGKGFVVLESQIDFVNDSVTINNPATSLQITAFSQGTNGGTVSPGAGSTLRYTPPSGQTQDTFTYTVYDGVDHANDKTAMVTVSIGPRNDPPVVTVQPQTVDEGVTDFLLPNDTVAIADPDANDTAAPGGQLKVTVNVTNGTLTLGAINGLNFTITGGKGDGTADSEMVFAGRLDALTPAFQNLKFTPPADFYGTATVVLTVDDQGNTGVVPGAATNNLVDTKTLTITVRPINDAPVNTVPGLQMRVSSDPWVFSQANNNKISVADALDAQFAPGGDVQVRVTLAVDNGTLTLLQPGTLAVTNNGSATVTVTGLTAAINAALASGLQYEGPLTGDTLTVTTNDLGNVDYRGQTAALEDVDTVLILPPTAPFAVPDRVSVDEGAPATDFTTLLNNDINGLGNVSSLNLHIKAVAASGSGATVTIINQGTGVQYTVPNVDFAGQDTFTYTIEDTVNPNDGDSTGTVTVTVNQINDEPSFAATNPPPVNEDAGAQSVPGFVTSFNAGSGETQGVLQYLVSGVSNSGLFAAGPAVAPNGTLTYTPAADAFGTATFSVAVQDDGGTALGGDDTSPAQEFTITVNSVNDAPTFTANNPPAVDEGAGAQTIADFATNFSPGPANESTQSLVTYTVSNVTDSGFFAVAPVVAANGRLTYAAATDAFGAATFTLTAQDDGGTANQGTDTSLPKTITITVNAVNDAPSFTASNPPAVDENAGAQTVPNWVASFNPGPNESAQTVLQYIVTDVSPSALFSVPPAVAANGTLTYAPAPHMAGVATFSVAVQDSGGTAKGTDTSAALPFTITINAVNDAPQNLINGSSDFAANPQATDDNTLLPFSAGNLNLLTVTDLDGDAANTYSVTVTADQGTVKFGADTAAATIQATGTRADVNAKLATLVYSPPQDFIGTAHVTLVTSDGGATGSGGAKTDTDSITITVAPYNDPPVAKDDLINTPEGTPINFNVLADNGNGVDTAGPNEGFQTIQVLSIAPTAVPGLQVLDLATGAFRYTPPDNEFNGQVTFTYVIQDNGRSRISGSIVDDPKTATGTVTITVTPVNDPPVAASDLHLISPNPAAGTTFAIPFSELTANDSPGPANESTQTLTVSAVHAINGTTKGTVQLVGNQIVYTAPANFDHLDSFEYTVTDNGTTNGQADPKSATAKVTIRDVVLSNLSGYVFLDINGDGVMSGEVPIVGVTVTLTGTDIENTPVNLSTTTGPDGRYVFTNVMPAAEGTTYSLHETQPQGYDDGPDTLGDQGGTIVANDTLAINVPLLGFAAGVQGSGNNFAENIPETGASVEVVEKVENLIKVGALRLFASDNYVLIPGGEPRLIDENTGGMLFETDAAGNVLWFADLGGWAGYVPQGPPANGTLNVNHNGTPVVMPVPDARMREVGTGGGGYLVRLIGTPADFAPPPAGEGEAFAAYANAVDLLLSRIA
jgi:hypothetical protein